MQAEALTSLINRIRKGIYLFRLLRIVKSKLANRLASGKNAFIIHGNADPDALASAFSLSSIFSGTIIAPGGLDRSSKVMAETIGIET
ncbi:MAG: hypothetical protein OEV21_06140, partial [Thermoplasmata archaeon]|nr:hypothetical protein [Thermoplasmata archaeon]